MRVKVETRLREARLIVPPETNPSFRGHLPPKSSRLRLIARNNRNRRIDVNILNAVSMRIYDGWYEKTHYFRTSMHTPNDDAPIH